MFVEREYVPEGYLFQDAFMGTKEAYQGKINFLAKMAQPEEWNYPGKSDSHDNFILKNYILHMIKLKVKEK